MRALPGVGVLLGFVIVAVRASVVAIVFVGLGARVAVMAECHALTRRDRRHALCRNR